MKIRRRVSIIICLIAAMILAASPVIAKDGQYPEGKIKIFGKRFSIALGLGYGRPTDTTFGDTFGKGGIGFGLGLFRPEMKDGLRWDPDFKFQHYKEDDRSAVIIGATGGIHYNFVDPKARPTVPFFELHGGPYYVNTTGGSSAIALGGNAVLGVEVNNRITFTVRYDLVEQVNDFDPSSWSINVSIKVW
ncbi:hypothetical protein J7K50_00045 [bacterium]|nr:hypothetical protein [bacterium]